MPKTDKRALLARLVEQLSSELARAKSQAQGAAAGATHEENRAESDKDMRSTEASYVARGHAERTAKLEQALVLLSHMELKSFDEKTPIEASALVELACAGKRSRYLLVVAAGGERIEGEDIQTLATQSPLGKALLGLSVGDEAEVQSPQGARIYEIVSLS
jgi:transcription elongation GreA/GreB family factor